jgi:hypothetical protein
MTECFWCNAIYDADKFSKCPDCQSDTNTKEITIIKEGE